MPSLTLSHPDPVAGGTGGRAVGETGRLSAGAVRRHEEVLGPQPRRQTQLRPAHHDGGGGPQHHVKFHHRLLIHRARTDDRLCLPPQAKPMEVQAIREFSEPRKLALQVNDLVTVVDHR